MHLKLVYAWRKYNLRSLCVHFRFLCVHIAFNLFFDDEHMPLAVKEYLTQRKVRFPFIICAFQIVLLFWGSLSETQMPRTL